MKELIEKLIDVNKQRLKYMNASALQTDSEYQEAYYSGIADEIENSIYDLEDMLEKIQKGHYYEVNR